MKKVTIVGVGALGSHLVLLLRNLPIQIKVIDFDRVETKNVASQFHGNPHVGKLKVQALQQTMQFMFGRKIDIVSNKLEGSNEEVLLGGSDLIIDCLDNVNSRWLVQHYARKHSTPCLHGGLAAGGVYGVAIWDEHFVLDTASGGEGAPTCENGEDLPFIVGVAAHLAEAVRHFITDGKKHGYSISPSHMSRV